MELLHFTDKALEEALQDEEKKLLRMSTLQEEIDIINKRIEKIKAEIERRKNNG